MMPLDALIQEWRSRLIEDCSEQSETVRSAILAWLLGPDPHRINEMEPQGLSLLLRGMDYRFRLLRDRYLRESPEQAYHRLIRRLASITSIRQKLQILVEQSRDRHRSVMMVVQDVVQEMLETDHYLREQCAQIRSNTPLPWLQTLLLFAALEEYALRPIHNKPLILLRILNHEKRSQRGGITQIPGKEMVHLISEQVSNPEENENYHRSDAKAIQSHEEALLCQETDRQRYRVQKAFEQYLDRELGEPALSWFRLYAQGYGQDDIATRLNLPIKQVYRLREKVSYHAIKIFSLRVEPELVAAWLGTSLKDHNFGLTPGQWERFWQELTPQQQLILTELKGGHSLPEIAAQHHLKLNQVMAEWGRLFLMAHHIRSD